MRKLRSREVLELAHVSQRAVIQARQCGCGMPYQYYNLLPPLLLTIIKNSPIIVLEVSFFLIFVFFNKGPHVV